MSASTLKAGLDGAPEVLERAFSLWREAQVVHEAPSWQGKPEARAIADEIAAHPEYESAVIGALHNESSLIVAYALLCLELMRSEALQNLPEELLQRRSKITLINGSFKNSMDLGGLARQIQKRASGRGVAQAKPT